MAAPTFGVAGTYRQGSSAAPAFAAPASVVSTSIVVIDMYLDVGATISSLPTGFAHVAGSPLAINPGGGGEHRIVRLWARNPAGSTYTVSLSANVYSNGFAWRADGCVATGDPWDTNSGTGTAVATATDVASGVTPAVSMTTQNNDQLKVFTGSNWGGGPWTPPTGFTEQLDTGDETLTVATLAQTTAGTTGSLTATCATSDRRGALLGSLLSVALIGGSDVTVTDATSTGIRWQSSPTGVAVGVNVADVTSVGQRWQSSPTSVTINPGASDVSPLGQRWQSSPTGVTFGLTIADVTSTGERWQSAIQSGVAIGGITPDAVSLGLRWISASGPGVTIGVGAADVPGGWTWRSGYESVASGVIAVDSPGAGFRLGASSASGDIATVVADQTSTGLGWRSADGVGVISGVVIPDVPSGSRWWSAGGLGVVTGVTVSDSPSGTRLGVSQAAVSVGSVVPDTPNGLRWLSGVSTVTVLSGGPITDVPGWFRFGESAATVVTSGLPTDEIDLIARVYIDRFTSTVIVHRFSSIVAIDRIA